MNWVIAQTPAQAADVVGALQGVPGEVQLLYVGADASAVETVGAAKIYHCPIGDDWVEEYAASLATFLKEQQAQIVGVPAGKAWGTVAAKVAVALETAVVSHVMKVDASDGVVFTRMVYGGAADRKEKVTDHAVVITVPAGAFTATPGAAAAVTPVALEKTDCGMKRVSVQKNEQETVQLGAASHVVCVGRGFPDKESLVLAEDLAKAIDGTVGCTRPVAEGLDWMTKDRYIGSTGAMLNASVYVACGVSGQIQHLSGAMGCKTIFAINRDPDALIFHHADYGLVGTVEDVLPKLVAALK